MSSLPYTEALKNLRNYFDSGATKPYEFRKKQLLALKKAIQQNEQAISNALYTDLGKSPEEAYATETGLIYSEISVALKNLHKWMKPKRVATNLLNVPATSKIYRDALGVVLIVAPWNYPLQLSLAPLIGAIAGGNCAVLKPSEFAPETASVLQKIIENIYPPQYVYVIQGNGAEVVPALMRHFRFDHIFYTGSVAVGKTVYKMAAEQLVPVTLELGGKSPTIVEADANISVAAKRIVFGKFLNMGQTCIAPDYVLVHQSVKNVLIENMVKTMDAFYGSNKAESYELGKIINEKRFDTLVGFLQQGNIIVGGAHNRNTLFIEPTIMDEVSQGSGLMQNEIFGPILPVLTFTNRQEAMQMVKQHANPLALYLFTSSKQAEEEWINNVNFGGGCINNTVVHAANHNLPFGGVGNSGIGGYHGKFSFDTFTRIKPVIKTPVWLNPSLKYPPFKGKLKLLKWFIK